MSDFDERDPFPEASVPEPAGVGSSGAPSDGTAHAAAPEPLAVEAGAPAAGERHVPPAAPAIGAPVSPPADSAASRAPLAPPAGEPSGQAAHAAAEAAPPRAPAARAAAGEPGAPEPSTPPASPAGEPPGLGVPPSEAPTLPMIPVEKLRFQAQASGQASAAEPPASAAPVAAAAVDPLIPAPAAPASRPAAPAAGDRAADARATILPAPPRDLLDRRQPLYRECRGYRLRLDPPDLARLRELPGSRGRSDDEIGEAFFDGQADRLAESIAGDVPTPSEIRVVVDPYSRQAFLALENRIRGILSF